MNKILEILCFICYSVLLVSLSWYGGIQYQNNIVKSLIEPFNLTENISEDMTFNFITIDREELKTLIESKINQSELYDLKFRDREYRLYNLTDISNVLTSNVFTSNYTKEIFDCDDFTLESIVQARQIFKGAAIGFLGVINENSSYGHAVDIFIDSEKNIWYFNPQNNEQYLLEDMPYDKVLEIWI